MRLDGRGFLAGFGSSADEGGERLEIGREGTRQTGVLVLRTWARLHVVAAGFALQRGVFGVVSDERVAARSSIGVAGWAGAAVVGGGRVVVVGGGELLADEGEEVVVRELGELGGGLRQVPEGVGGRKVHGRLLTGHRPRRPR